jgi:hypothetical protein
LLIVEDSFVAYSLPTEAIVVPPRKVQYQTYKYEIFMDGRGLRDNSAADLAINVLVF